MASEASITVRCHGRGGPTHLTVAVDGSRTAWRLPCTEATHGTQEDAVEVTLTTRQLKLALQAAQPSDVTQSACIADLQPGAWRQLAYNIRPAEASEEAPSSSISVPLFVVPATGTVIDSQHKAAPQQRQYRDWVVPGIDYWNEDDGTVKELTVIELTKIAQATAGSSRQHNQTAAAALESPAAAAAPSPLADLASCRNGRRTRQAAAAAMILGIGAENQISVSQAEAANVLSALLAADGPLTTKQTRQLLQFVYDQDLSMQQVLSGLLHHHGELAFLKMISPAIRKCTGQVFVAALEADSSLMTQFLQSLSSTDEEIAAAAAEGLGCFVATAKRAASWLLHVVIETGSGLQLLAKALLSQHDVLISECRSYLQAGQLYNLLPLSAAGRHIRFFMRHAGMAACMETITQCHVQLFNNQQHQGTPHVALALLLVILLKEQRCQADAWAEAYGQAKPVLAHLGMSVAQALLDTEAAKGPGSCHQQALATLQGMLELAARHSDAAADDAASLLAQYDLTPVVNVLQHEGAAPALAAFLLDTLASSRTGRQLLVPYAAQLAEAAGSSSSNAGISLAAVRILCRLDCNLGTGDGPVQSLLLPHLDVMLSTLAQHHAVTFVPCTGGYIEVVSDALQWLNTMHNDSMHSPLSATAERIDLLAALIQGLPGHVRPPPRYLRSFSWRAWQELGHLAGFVIRQHEGAKLLTSSKGPEALCSIICWLASDVIWPLSMSSPAYSDLPASDEALSALAAGLKQAVQILAPSAANTVLSHAEVRNLRESLRRVDFASCTPGAPYLLPCLSAIAAGRLEICRGVSSFEKAFFSLEAIALLPAGAYQSAWFIKDFHDVAKMQSSKLQASARQQCMQTLETVKDRHKIMQSRLQATVQQAQWGLQQAALACAQVFRERYKADRLHVDMTVQLGGLAAADQYLEKITRLLANFQKQMCPMTSCL